ncbi:hypothetical protein VCHA34P131_40077 [Vibrio chagasii]|nr:hypothetical protein VCHA34P115_20040 [Vibrio chagasii]CAH6915768.1 hypothetical protein VCHA34P131_40077 [Vibrio chagasii]CAH6945859.1 hypothetical protein VCHA34P121_40050 [Vibrio chagasii]CAH6956421.1 hypothetical protein VCHA48P442_110051 [Vibrio chagasii]CAH7377975.1 hypothetical protein VCHA51O444_30442 [Vibrio chagasii]
MGHTQNNIQHSLLTLISHPIMAYCIFEYVPNYVTLCTINLVQKYGL